MAGIRIHVVVDPDLLRRVDAATSDGVSRGEFVRRALEKALGSVSANPQAPVPSRASGKVQGRTTPVPLKADIGLAGESAPSEPSLDRLRERGLIKPAKSFERKFNPQPKR